jgi:sugar phosphate permease
VLLRGVLTLGFFSIDAYVALLLVEVRGWSATAAGLALTGATVSWTVGSWAQARWSRRHRPETFVRIGLPIVALGIASLGLGLIPSVPAEVVVPAFALAGFGMGVTYSQFALIVLRDVTGAEQGRVTAGLTLADAIGTAVGSGLTAAMVAAAIRSGAGPAPGIAGGVVVGTLVILAAFAISSRLSPAAAPVPASVRT